MHISRIEILKGYEIDHPLTKQMEGFLAILLERLNLVRSDWGKPMIITSGYRPPFLNTKVGGAPNSAHLTCRAVDIADPKGTLKAWLTPEKLTKYGLWMEDPAATPTWVHLQIRPAKNRIFKLK